MGLFDVTQPFISVPPASADPVHNYNVIQEALNSAGTIYIGGAGVYEIHGTLTIQSSTRLILGEDVTIKHSSRANRNYRPLMVNSAFKRAGTVVTVTSSGTTCTVTWNNHGRKAGDWVAIAGASAETGYVGVFEVATVTGPNAFTYIAFETPSATPATGTVFAWVADTDIYIEGGTWDYNQSELIGADTLDKMGLMFVHVRNLQFHQAQINNVNKYAIFPINVRDFTAHNLRFDTASDGIHLGGVSGADIQDIAGTFGDDILAMLTDQGTSNYNIGTWMKFPFRMVEAKNLRSYNSLQSGIKLTGGTHPYRSVTIDGLYGQFANAPITIFEDPPFGLLAPDIDYITLRNIRPDSWGTTLGGVRMTTAADTAVIGRMDIDGITATGMSGTQKLIDLRSTGAGTYTINTLTVRNIEYDIGSLSGAGGGIHVGANGVINSLVVDGFRMRGASTNNFFLLVSGAGATVTRAMLSNGYTHSGNGFFVRYESTAGAADVYLNSVHTQLTNNPVDFRRACNLDAVNWRHSGSTPININGTGTYILRGGVTYAAGAAYVIAGGASVEVYGFGFRADPITPALASTVGQHLTSTQATTEGGPAVLGPAGWVALGTGASGINTVIT